MYFLFSLEPLTRAPFKDGIVSLAGPVYDVADSAHPATVSQRNRIQFITMGTKGVSSEMSCCPAIGVGAGIHAPMSGYAAARLPAVIQHRLISAWLVII